LVFVGRHPEIGLEKKAGHKERCQNKDFTDGEPHKKCLKCLKLENKREQQALTTDNGELDLAASVAEKSNHAIGKVGELWYADLILKDSRFNDVRSSCHGEERC
jgi:hypothetical protein